MNTGVRVVKNVVRIILITVMFNFNNVLQRTHAHGPMRTHTHVLPLKTMFYFGRQGKDGVFHLLVHGDCGYHAFSTNGFDWDTSPKGGTTCAFPRVKVPHQNGMAAPFTIPGRPRSEVSIRSNWATHTTTTAHHSNDCSFVSTRVPLILFLFFLVLD